LIVLFCIFHDLTQNDVKFIQTGRIAVHFSVQFCFCLTSVIFWVYIFLTYLIVIAFKRNIFVFDYIFAILSCFLLVAYPLIDFILLSLSLQLTFIFIFDLLFIISRSIYFTVLQV
jgi:hypothetical protein